MKSNYSNSHAHFQGRPARGAAEFFVWRNYRAMRKEVIKCFAIVRTVHFAVRVNA